MLEEFSKHWERIDVITPSVLTHNSPFDSAQGKQLITHFSNIFFHPSPHGLWYQPFWIAKKGTELIATHKHDVTTVHEYPPFYNGIGAHWLRKKTGIPGVLEIHHIVGYPVASSFTEQIGALLSRLWLKTDASRFSAVRTVNAEVKNTLTQWGVPADHISVVPSF